VERAGRGLGSDRLPPILQELKSRMEATSLPSAREVAEELLSDPARRSRLSAYARSRYGIQNDDSEDLLQETAVELIRQLRYVRSPDAFVLTVFRSRCVRFVAGKIGSRKVFGQDVCEREAADPLLPEHLERRLQLREALARVTSLCRRLLCAYYYEGEPLEEAARRFSLSYDGVTKTLSRCLKKMREALI
jgi:RNA polymerase sigma factor (sigma-70 family)